MAETTGMAKPKNGQGLHPMVANIGRGKINEKKKRYSEEFYQIDAWRNAHSNLKPDSFTLSSDVWAQMQQNPDQIEKILDQYIQKTAETDDPRMAINRLFATDQYIQDGPKANKAAPNLYKQIVSNLSTFYKQYLAAK